jgi:hypothetical protein
MALLIDAPPYDLADAEELDAFIQELEDVRRARTHSSEDLARIDRHLQLARAALAEKLLEPA